MSDLELAMAEACLNERQKGSVMETLGVLIMKCVNRHEEDTVNGPLVTVVLAPDEYPFSLKGTLSFNLHSQADLDAYQVGRKFRLTPEPLPAPKKE